jgi:predicted phosphodiesterase
MILHPDSLVILTADWHLDDQPSNEYRWQVFHELGRLLQGSDLNTVFILGDLTDRKDRHSAALVNRLIEALQQLPATITIIMGNHDKPVHGTPYWQFLNVLPHVAFVDEPTVTPTGLALLPYAAEPVREWRNVNLKQAKAIFMHQTVAGAVGDNGFVIEDDKLPILPRGVPVYSGDIHTPQKVGTVTYVGAPHPIKFGDRYQCRMLRLDAKFKIAEEITLLPPKKMISQVRSLDELRNLAVDPGDQLRVRFALPAGEMANWPQTEAAIAAWAEQQQVTVASVEAILETGDRKSVLGDLLADPQEVLKAFAEAEGLDDKLLDYGLALLREAAA